MRSLLRLLASYWTAFAVLFALAVLGIVNDHVAHDRGAMFLPGNDLADVIRAIRDGAPGRVHSLIWLRTALQLLVLAGGVAVILAGRASRQSLWRFLGSVRMAAPLILLIAVCIIRGTLWEAREGNDAAQEHIYLTLWFRTLLAFLVANLVVSVLRRYPWRLHHIGFITVHTGIIILLAAGQIKFLFGRSGFVALWEGESSAAVEQYHDVLNLARTGRDGEALKVPADLAKGTPGLLTHAVYRLSPPDASAPPIDVRIDDILPHARRAMHVEDGGSATNPAVELELVLQGQVQHRTWLLARDPQRHQELFNNLLFLAFTEIEDADRLRQILSPTHELTSTSKGVLVLHAGQGADAPMLRLPVEEGLGKTVPIEGTTYTVSLLRYYRNFQLDRDRTGEDRFQDLPGDPNPAVRLRVNGAEGEAEYLVYAKFEKMNPHRIAGSEAIPLAVEYQGWEGQGVRPPSTSAIMLFRGPEHLHYLMTSRKGQTESGDVEIGKAYPYVGMPAGMLAFRVLRSFDRADVTDLYEPAPPEDKEAMPALLMTASSGAERSQGWLPWSGRLELTAGKERVVLQYGRDRVPLPFALKLLDFRKRDYPGTDNPASFESDVRLSDPESKSAIESMIYMNNPLRYQGWTFYQSSFEVDADGRERSVFSAAYDPSSPVFYTGSVTFVAGILMIFYLRPYLLRREKLLAGRRRSDPDGRAGAAG